MRLVGAKLGSRAANLVSWEQELPSGATFENLIYLAKYLKCVHIVLPANQMHQIRTLSEKSITPTL